MQVTDQPSPDAPPLTQAIIAQLVYWSHDAQIHNVANLKETAQSESLKEYLRTSFSMI